MPAPLSNLMSAIDAPVSSLRHSIFSCTPLSDLSRHGTLSDWIRISWRSGAPAGSCVMKASLFCLMCLGCQPRAEHVFGIGLADLDLLLVREMAQGGSRLGERRVGK